MMANPSVNTVVIATRHDSHASLVSKALAAGRHVFVEKPLAIRLDEIDAVRPGPGRPRIVAPAPPAGPS